MLKECYSLRMRASQENRHISGAERLISFPELEDATSGMLARAINHPRGRAENITLTIEAVNHEHVHRKPLLNFSTFPAKSWQQGQECAGTLLVNLGLSPALVKTSIRHLATGLSSQGGVMRGAMLLDVQNGERLEPDSMRGVRVSRMDVEPEARSSIERLLRERCLDNPRVIEAWVLASKVALYPQIIAELCWSDDPDYVTGYVASQKNGYQRITPIKATGNEVGGRIFFVRPQSDIRQLIDDLQFDPVVFTAPLIGCA